MYILVKFHFSIHSNTSTLYDLEALMAKTISDAVTRGESVPLKYFVVSHLRVSRIRFPYLPSCTLVEPPACFNPLFAAFCNVFS